MWISSVDRDSGFTNGRYKFKITHGVKKNVKIPFILSLLCISYVAVDSPGELLIAAKFAFLIGAIFQLVVGLALLIAAAHICFIKVKRTKRKRFWMTIGCSLALLGMLFLLGALIAFTNYLAALEIIYEVKRAAMF